jgi:hypothetical protein
MGGLREPGPPDFSDFLGCIERGPVRCRAGSSLRILHSVNRKRIIVSG